MVVPIIASLSRDLFLTVPRELQDGRDRARRHALGDRARRRAPLHGLRRRGGHVPRPRTRARRGDRGRAGDRRRQRRSHKSLFATGDTLASRIALQFPGATSQLHISVAVLPRAGPARDRAGHEPPRPVDLAPLRRAHGGDPVTTAVMDPEAPLVASGNLRRRQIVSRGVPARRHRAPPSRRRPCWGSWSYGVSSRGLKAISSDFLTEAPPPLRRLRAAASRRRSSAPR